MRRALLIFALLSGQLFGACHVVSKTGGGTKTGADWTNPAQFGVTSGFTGTTFVTNDSYFFMDETVITGSLTGVTVLNAAASPVPTVTRASGSFIVDGVTVGMRIRFKGFTNFNNNTDWFEVVSVGATVLGVADPGEGAMTLPPTIMISESSTSGAVSYIARDPTNDYPAFTTSIANVSFFKAWGAAGAGNHCTDTGWVQATMGSGSAFFSGGATGLISLGSGDLFDGQLRTDEVSGHGFVADCSRNTGFFLKCFTNGDGVKIRYTEVFGQGLAANPSTVNVYNMTGATVTVASNILTITNMGAGPYVPLGPLIVGQQVKITSGVSAPASFLQSKLLTVCDHAVNAACVVASATQFSAAFTHADFGPDSTSTCAACIEVNISENAISMNTRANMTLEYNFIHDTADGPITWGGGSNNNLIQYNVIDRVYASNAVHGGGIVGNQAGITITARDTTIRYNKIYDVTGTAVFDVLSSAAISVLSIGSISVASNVVTINFSGASAIPAVGQSFMPRNIATATFLNNQVLHVATSTISQITASFTHADYPLTADSGTLLRANDNLQFYGNVVSGTPGNRGAGTGDYIFFCGILTANTNACSNIQIFNNTFDKFSEVGALYFAGNYGSMTWQNNLAVDVNYGTSLTPSSTDLTVTDDHNTFLCLTGSTCYSNHGVIEGFNCSNDECLPNASVGNQTNPFTAGSYPTNVLKFDLAAATTSGAAVAYTDPNGVVAPQGGIYNRGAYEFAAVASSYLVSLNVSGTWTGTIVGSSGNPASTVNCTVTAGVPSGTCSETQNAGATPTYTPTVTVGSLTGWSGGGCSGTGTCTPTVNSPLTLTMTGNAPATCTFTCVSNNINSPATVSCTAALTGLSSNYLWELTEPINGNVIAACNTDNCKTGATGNLQYTGSGIYTLIAIGNGVFCTASTQPLNINTGAGSAAH